MLLLPIMYGFYELVFGQRGHVVDGIGAKEVFIQTFVGHPSVVCSLRWFDVSPAGLISGDLGDFPNLFAVGKDVGSATFVPSGPRGKCLARAIISSWTVKYPPSGSIVGMEFVVLRTARDMIIAMGCKWRMFGVPLNDMAQVYYNNQGVVKNTSLPESILFKKYNAINNHATREAASAGVLHVTQKDTLSTFWRLAQIIETILYNLWALGFRPLGGLGTFCASATVGGQRQAGLWSAKQSCKAKCSAALVVLYYSLDADRMLDKAAKPKHSNKMKDAIMLDASHHMLAGDVQTVSWTTLLIAAGCMSRSKIYFAFRNPWHHWWHHDVGSIVLCKKFMLLLLIWNIEESRNVTRTLL
jgi:hypothetical protein